MSPNLVFLVGAPRSGTTWLQRLIASHPRVQTAQESDLFDVHIGPQLRAFRAYADTSRGPLGMASYMDEGEFIAIIRQFALALLEPALRTLQPRDWFLEKTPSHVLYLPEIAEVFPEARVIHALRDGRDVACSILAAAKSWGSDWAPRSVAEAARMWCEHVMAFRQFCETHGTGRTLELRYEDFLAAPEDGLRAVFDFLTVGDDQIDVTSIVGRNRFGSRESTPIPNIGTQGVVEDPEGFCRRGTVGNWRRELTWWQKRQFNSIAGHVLKRVGYG